MLINSKINVRCAWVAAMLAVWLSHSLAQADPVDPGIITVAASYGSYDFADQRNLDNRDFAGAALGLHFSKSFSTALYYSRSHAEGDVNDKRRFENYYVEGLFYGNTESQWRPYVALGLGEILQAEGKISSETTLHTGLGLHWRLSPKWALRADWRYFYSFDEDIADQTFMTTAVFRFAGGEH